MNERDDRTLRFYGGARVVQRIKRNILYFRCLTKQKGIEMCMDWTGTFVKCEMLLICDRMSVLFHMWQLFHLYVES